MPRGSWVKYLSDEKASSILDVSERQIRRLAEQGRLKREPTGQIKGVTTESVLRLSRAKARGQYKRGWKKGRKRKPRSRSLPPVDTPHFPEENE